LISEFQGVPDFIEGNYQIVSKLFQYEVKPYDLYLSNQLSKEEFKSKTQEKKWTLPSNKRSKTWLNAISAYTEDYHYVILDTNNDSDFVDEVIVSFDMKSKYDFQTDVENKKKYYPILNFKYYLYGLDSIYNINRKIRLFPVQNHPHAYLEMEGIIDSLLDTYTLFLEFKDYRKAQLNLFNVNYTIAVQGLEPKWLRFVIKPDSLQYDKRNLVFQKNFTYSLKDTIEFSKKFYQISSVNSDFSGFTLKRVDPKEKRYGYRLGSLTKNFKLKSLDGEEIEISDFLESPNKKYLLIEFWGTWCAPCIELTPALKQLYKDVSESTTFLSIALDSDVKKVLKYVAENNLNWTHSFVNRYQRKGSIIDGLKVTSYPTFILLNRNREVVYRGGSESLKEIKKILMN
jgi:thiol-disulfide isomerase/thioredoxin